MSYDKFLFAVNRHVVMHPTIDSRVTDKGRFKSGKKERGKIQAKTLDNRVGSAYSILEINVMYTFIKWG